MKYPPSKYQKDIFRQFETTSNDMLIQAVAGSGKSSTIIELSHRAAGKNLFLAFNKAIADETKEKVPTYVESLTLHSLGCKAIYRKFGGNITVNKNKTYLFIKKRIEKWKVPYKEIAGTYVNITRLVDIYRMTLCQTQEELTDTAADMGVVIKKQQIEWALEIIGDLQQYNNRFPKIIDFTDMVYLPAINPTILLPDYDNVFIDECQDLNNAQHTLVERLTRKARAIYVGDRFQSIYGFAGSNTASFERIKQRKGIVEMPLSVCYRCPLRVLDHANKVYDILEPREDVIRGEVRTGFLSEATDGDMIICRNLKPLILAYFTLILEEKKAFIRGKDLGEGLIALAKPYEGGSINNLLKGLREDLDDKYQVLLERGVPKPLKHPSYIALSEQIGCLIFIAGKYQSVREIITLLEGMFDDNTKKGILLCTIHKAKGLEADTVFFLNKHLIPSRYATTEEQLEQERNLEYVAITRAKKKLIYVKI